MTLKVKEIITAGYEIETLVPISEIEKIQDHAKGSMIYLKTNNRFLIVSDSFETLSNKLGVL